MEERSTKPLFDRVERALGSRLSALDRLPRLRITICGRSMYSWPAMVRFGLIVGVAIFSAAAILLGIPLAVAVAVIAANLCMLVVYEKCSRRFYRGQRYVLLQGWLSALASTVLALIWTPEWLWQGLDGWSLAVAAALATGRIGCFLGGCCHGRAGRSGVCYPWRAPVTSLREDSRLRVLPVQIYESLLLVLIFMLGALSLSQYSKGEIFVLLSAGYGAGRFGLEFLRGDGRRYWLRLSESQWISSGLVLLALVVADRGEGFQLSRQSLLSGFALAMILCFAWFGRRHLSAPVVRPLDKKDHRELRAVLESARTTALGLLREGSKRSIRVETRTSRGLVVELQAYKERGPKIDAIRIWGLDRQVDRGTAELVALILGGTLGAAEQLELVVTNLAGKWQMNIKPATESRRFRAITRRWRRNYAPLDGEMCSRLSA